MSIKKAQINNPNLTLSLLINSENTYEGFLIIFLALKMAVSAFFSK